LAGDCPIEQAVLLVGGLGTRLRPLTYLRPKALVPVMNRPLISYEIQLLALHGVRDIILAVGYAAEALREGLGDGSRWGVSLSYREDPTPLGTAGAIRNVADLLDDAFFCMNGDLIFDLDLGQIARRHLETGAMVTHALRQVSDISQYGLVECDDSGRVTAFREKAPRDETGRNTVNFGLYVMSRQVVEHIPAGAAYSSEYDLFPRLLGAQFPLHGFLPDAPGYWSDVGRLGTYLQANHDLLGGALPWVSAQNPFGVLREPVDASASVDVAGTAQVGPFVSVGEEVHIGPNAVVRNSILCDGATVGAGAVLEDTIVAWGASVEPGAHRNAAVVMPSDWQEPA
jgi:NDP-sugar pyrophosphorylase family protein